MPETASPGTIQDAETAQLPQSTRPVAAVVRHAGCVCGSSADGQDGGDLARAQAAVVAHPVDVEPVVRRRGVDLEADRLPLVDADVGGEALDRGAARPADVPLARRIARLGVLAGDRVRDRRVARRRGGRCGADDQGEGKAAEAGRCQAEDPRGDAHLAEATRPCAIRHWSSGESSPPPWAKRWRPRRAGRAADRTRCRPRTSPGRSTARSAGGSRRRRPCCPRSPAAGPS